MTPNRSSFLLLFLLSLTAGCTGPGANRTDAPSANRRIIATEAAPAAIGPYSQAVQVGNVLYLSGQIGLDPATGEMVPGGVRAETRRVLDNLRAVAEAAGFSMSDVVQTQVFLTDLSEYAAMNEEYAAYFSAGAPARATVQVAALPRGARVEIMCTAAK